MKSLYQYKKFAEYWNERAGDEGEGYKRLVLDPIMFGILGDLENKAILELGCGNGYLAKKFIEQNPARLILLDISSHNLEFAKEKTKDPRVEFLEQDATKPWRVRTRTVDVVYSNMMLNEVENIKTPIEETFRILKPGGVFIFSVTHPAWDLFAYAQEKVGVKSDRFKGLGNYFYRGFTKFLMGSNSRHNPALARKYKEEFELEHFQRPIEDYFNQLTDTGFVVKKIFEPQMTKELLSESPRFVDYQDHPIGLIFYCKKELATKDQNQL